MILGTLCTPGAITVTKSETLSTVAKVMKEHNIGAVLVEENRRPVGIVTDRDLALAIGAGGKSVYSEVQEVMTPHVLAMSEETDFLTATHMMRERKVRRLPIVDKQDRLVGMVTLDDLLRVLGRELANLAESIRDEVHVR